MQIGQSGHGNDWSPVNGSAPYWLNFLVWVLRQGFLFQLTTVGILIFGVGILAGRIDSPMLDAWKTMAKSSAKTASETAATSSKIKDIAEQTDEQVNLLKAIKRDIEEEKEINQRFERKLDR